MANHVCSTPHNRQYSAALFTLSEPVQADCAPYYRANPHPERCGRLDH
jgi:hypothetical protein